jgi:hypothetical protein
LATNIPTEMADRILVKQCNLACQSCEHIPIEGSETCSVTGKSVQCSKHAPTYPMLFVKPIVQCGKLLADSALYRAALLVSAAEAEASQEDCRDPGNVSEVFMSNDVSGDVPVNPSAGEEVDAVPFVPMPRGETDLDSVRSSVLPPPNMVSEETDGNALLEPGTTGAQARLKLKT